MAKPFFYRITAADFLAAVVTIPEADRAAWVLSLALDMVTADVDTAKSQFAINIINEAAEFSGKKREAANKRWSKVQKQKDAPDIQTGAVHMQSNASSSTEAVTVTEQPKPLKTVSRFAPPTLDEVKSYCQERNNFVDPEKFIDFYESKGWMVGRNKMKSWKASVRTWEKDSKPEKANMTIPNPKGGFREFDLK